MTLRILGFAGCLWLLTASAQAVTPGATQKKTAASPLPANAIARVNNALLLKSSYTARWRGFVRRVPPHMRNNRKLKKRFLNHMIDGLVLAEEARRKGHKIADKKVYAFLQRVRYFQNKQGKLDMRMVKMVVTRYYRMTVKQYLEQLKRDMLAAKIRRQFLKKLKVDPATAKKAFLTENRQVKVRWLALDQEKVQWTGKPAANEIQSMLKQQRPKLQAWYKNNTALYQRAETIRARHLMLSTRGTSETVVREKLKKLRLQLLAKPSLFATLASQHSQALDKTRGGDLGWFSRGEMVAPFEKVAFSMKKPFAISGIVKTRFGLHLVQFLGRRAGSHRPFSAADVQRDVAQRVWRDEKIQAQLLDTATRLLSSLRKGMTWESLVKSLKVTPGKAGSRPSSQPSKRPSGLPESLQKAWSVGLSNFTGRGTEVFLGAKLTPPLTKRLLTLTNKNKHFASPLKRGARVYVLQFAQERDPGEKGWAAIKSRWLPRYKQSQFRKIMKRLRKNAKITVNWSAM